MKILSSLLILIAVYSHVQSQDIIMRNGSDTISSGSFYDPAGIANYMPGTDLIFTIYPEKTGKYLIADFSFLDIEKFDDYLKIYDGESIEAPLIGSFNNFNPLRGKIIAGMKNKSGALTFVFHAGNSSGNNFRGWLATLSCIDSGAQYYEYLPSVLHYRFEGARNASDVSEFLEYIGGNSLINRCAVDNKNSSLYIFTDFPEAELQIREKILSSHLLLGYPIKIQFLGISKSN